MSSIHAIRTLISSSLAALAMLPAVGFSQELPAPMPVTGTLDYRMNERVIQVPAGPDDVLLETTVFQP
jgi:hypothetical protein